MAETAPDDEKTQARNRWILSIALSALGIVGLGLVLVMFSQSRVFQIDQATSILVAREDFTGDAVGELVGQAVGGAFSLLFMFWGGSLLLSEGERKLGLVIWLSSFLMLYFVAKNTRDTLTLSELRVDARGQVALCTGYRLGQRAWTESATFSQIQSVTFQVGQGIRYGVTFTGKQGTFCSLHNRTLSKDEARQSAGWLKRVIGGPGKTNVQEIY